MRIADLTRAQEGPMLRVTRRFARKKVKQLTGRETEGMLGPFDAYARTPRLLFGVGMLEDDRERHRKDRRRATKQRRLPAGRGCRCRCLRRA